MRTPYFEIEEDRETDQDLQIKIKCYTIGASLNLEKNANAQMHSMALIVRSRKSERWRP